MFVGYQPVINGRNLVNLCQIVYNLWKPNYSTKYIHSSNYTPAVKWKAVHFYLRQVIQNFKSAAFPLFWNFLKISISLARICWNQDEEYCSRTGTQGDLFGRSALFLVVTNGDNYALDNYPIERVWMNLNTLDVLNTFSTT